MTRFYRKLLDESERNHVASSPLRKLASWGHNAFPPSSTARPLSDFELARIARDEGREVELNNGNRVIGIRDLLTAGLNLAAPNTRRLGLVHNVKVQQQQRDADAVQTHRAVGTAASRKEIIERRLRFSSGWGTSRQGLYGRNRRESKMP